MSNIKVVSTLLIGFLFLVVEGSECSGSPKALTESGQKAYQTLLTANQFEGDAIGYAAAPSKLVEAFRILLKEKDGDLAFKDLLGRATPAGQLYALCGLYFTDHEFFLAEVEKHRFRSDFIQVQFGCIGSRMPASAIVEVKSANAVRLSSTSESLSEWLKDHPKIAENGYQLDIIGGGYPSEFIRRANSN